MDMYLAIGGILLAMIILTLQQVPDAIAYLCKPVLSPTPVGIRTLQKYVRSMGFSLHHIAGTNWELLEGEICDFKQYLVPVEDVRLSSSGERQNIIFVNRCLAYAYVERYQKCGVTFSFGEYLVIVHDEDFKQEFRMLCESHKEIIWNLARYGKERPSFADQFMFRFFPERYARLFLQSPGVS